MELVILMSRMGVSNSSGIAGILWLVKLWIFPYVTRSEILPRNEVSFHR